MSDPRSPADLAALIADPARLVRAVASGRRRGRLPEWRRIEIRPVLVRGETLLQVVRFDDRQSFTAQHGPGEAAAVVDAALAMPFGSWLVEVLVPDAEGQITAGERWQFRSTKAGWRCHREDIAAPDRRLDHDRTKPRMLDPVDPVLIGVGISTPAGRVRGDRRDKFHQVDEFLRILAADLADSGLPDDRPLRIVDLGCGNAYLTFATAAWLHRQGRDARIVGVDSRPSALRRNAQLAHELGMSGTLAFEADDISSTSAVDGADIVLALHACDTATDDALARAVRARAALILAAPCCHHDVQRQLRATATMPDWGAAILRDGILRERLGDVLTDAIRAQVLREHGYRVEVVEFVDSRHTPRNALIRAHRTDAAPDAQALARLDGLIGTWGIEPRLVALLGRGRAG